SFSSVLIPRVLSPFRREYTNTTLAQFKGSRSSSTNGKTAAIPEPYPINLQLPWQFCHEIITEETEESKKLHDQQKW
ncbi:hypothetical protein, partial [Cerasicoccus arenae]